MAMDWKPHARRLADQVAGAGSRWHPAVTAVPRHLLVPRWWDRGRAADGLADPDRWLTTAYRDISIVTEIQGRHADHAEDDEPAPESRMPTSSSTKPSLVLRMYRHAQLEGAERILDVGTGSGYGAALLATRFGDGRVTTVDVGRHTVEAARDRLHGIGLYPRVEVCDATGGLPSNADRIVAMVGMPGIPASWIDALEPGGRLVTTLRDARIVITATKHDDGRAYGRVEWDRATFMATRDSDDGYPPGVSDLFTLVADATGEDVTREKHPVVNVTDAWELYSYLAVMCPGIVHHYDGGGDTRTQWLLHPDGSWARATARGHEPPEVHQGGPRRLWQVLEAARDRWIREGELPLYGAHATVDPDGTMTLVRGTPNGGRWEATVPPARPAYTAEPA